MMGLYCCWLGVPNVFSNLAMIDKESIRSELHVFQNKRTERFSTMRDCNTAELHSIRVSSSHVVLLQTRASFKKKKHQFEEVHRLQVSIIALSTILQSSMSKCPPCPKRHNV